jgi:putative ABC transport system permease protein
MKLLAAAALALRVLLHDRARLATSTAGIAFALLLMLLQLGFRNSLLDSSLELLHQLDADLVVMHRDKMPFLRRVSMPKERLYQSMSVPGVETAYPVWIALRHWKNLEDGTERPIRVIGIDPDDPAFLNEEVNAAAQRLKLPGTALIDRRSRRQYGRIGPGPAQVGRRPIEVIGSFSLGSDFEVDGNLIVSDATFFDFAPHQVRTVEMALVQVALGVDPSGVVSELRRVLPTDVAVYSKEDLLRRDLVYWERRTPISFILLAGVVFGFSVGVVICYQILYTNVVDHLKEFATLKAMGYGDLFLRCVVIIKAWLLSLLGLLPGALVSAGMLYGLSQATGLPAHFSWGDLLQVLLLSLGMCTLAGAMALQSVAKLDPAELY